MKRAKRGFSLIELIVVIAIISILLGLVLAVIATVQRNIKESAAKTQLAIVAHAIEQYRLDFGSYPPDDFPTSSGAECLAWHLCRKIKKGDTEYGPYLEIIPKDHDGNGYRELYSSLNTPYSYVITVDEKGKEHGYLSADCGWDRKLGGNLDPAIGFVPDGSGQDADNFYQR